MQSSAPLSTAIPRDLTPVRAHLPTTLTPADDLLWTPETQLLLASFVPPPPTVSVSTRLSNPRKRHLARRLISLGAAPTPAEVVPELDSKTRLCNQTFLSSRRAFPDLKSRSSLFEASMTKCNLPLEAGKPWRVSHAPPLVPLMHWSTKELAYQPPMPLKWSSSQLDFVDEWPIVSLLDDSLLTNDEAKFAKHVAKRRSKKLTKLPGDAYTIVLPGLPSRQQASSMPELHRRRCGSSLGGASTVTNDGAGAGAAAEATAAASNFFGLTDGEEADGQAAHRRPLTIAQQMNRDRATRAHEKATPTKYVPPQSMINGRVKAVPDASNASVSHLRSRVAQEPKGTAPLMPPALSSAKNKELRHANVTAKDHPVSLPKRQAVVVPKQAAAPEPVARTPAGTAAPRPARPAANMVITTVKQPPSSHRKEKLSPAGNPSSNTPQTAASTEALGGDMDHSTDVSRIPSEMAVTRVQAMARGRAARKAPKPVHPTMAHSHLGDSYGANSSRHRIMEDTAAIRVQTFARGLGPRQAARRLQAERQEAAVKVQAARRGHLSRQSVGSQIASKKQEEVAAATLLQTRARGHKSRQERVTQERAAVSMQRVHRGASDRKMVCRLRAENVGQEDKVEEPQAAKAANVETDAAATRLQAAHRGSAARARIAAHRTE